MRRLPRRPWLIGVALIAVAVLGVSLAGDGVPGIPHFGGTPLLGAKPAITVTPAANAKDLPATTEIGANVKHGKLSAVTLTQQGGGQMGGAIRADGSSWIPDKPLELGKTYTAKATATGSHGRKATSSTTFSTMSKEAAANRVDSSLYMHTGGSYGVAMPVVVEFSQEIPESVRPQIERRLFVKSDPPQPGAWRWFAKKQALYRPANYWKPGTKLTVRAALDGLPLGNGRFGDEDASANATIGRDLEMRVENSTKMLSVYESGKLIRTMPVSLGAPSTPSSSGTMVIMERDESTIFDTRAELGPTEGYRIPIDYAQRLTWGGQFIHSAPWSVGAQGNTNTSHGCVNLSPADAEWLFYQTKVGDPITVRGTEVGLDPGDGWTAWDTSWKDFLKGTKQ